MSAKGKWKFEKTDYSDRHPYTLRGCLSPTYLFPKGHAIAKSIKKSEDYADVKLGSINVYYGVHTHVALARKIFRFFLMKVIDVIIHDQSIFMFPNTRGVHMYIEIRESRDGLGKYPFCIFKLSAKSRKKPLHISLNDDQKSAALEYHRIGRKYPSLKSNYGKII